MGGFGPVPLSYQEILAWMTCTRRTLQPWEVRVLRRLSVEYISMLSRAEDENCPDPWAGELSDEELRSVAFKLRAAMRGG